MSPAAGGYWCPICGAVAKTRSVSRRRGLSGQALYLLSLTSSMSPAGGGYRHINDPNSVQLQCVPRGRGLSVHNQIIKYPSRVCPPVVGVIGRLNMGRRPRHSLSPGCGGYRLYDRVPPGVWKCIPRIRGLSVLQRVSPASLYVCPPHAGVIDQLVFSELMVFGAGPVNGGMDDSESSP